MVIRNEALLQAWRWRAVLQKAVARFFDTRDFLPLDTPILVPTPGTEVHLDYFATQWHDHRGQAYPLYLRSSPELHLKQALAAGAERVYHLGKCFRNGGELSAWHHPEFTMLEWYQAGQSYTGLMDETYTFMQETLAACQAAACPVALRLPARPLRLSVFEAFDQHVGIPLLDQDPDLAAKAMAKGFASVRADDDFETAFFKLLLDAVEPALAKESVAVLYDYPASQAALAVVQAGRAQRFEYYVAGVELCNAFYELTDPHDNQRRYHEATARRQAMGKATIPLDEDFLDAIERGLPASAGIALGFDRWLALLRGDSQLAQALPFRRMPPYTRVLKTLGLNHP